MQITELRAIRDGATPLEDYKGYAVDQRGNVWSYLSNWRGYGTRKLKQHKDNYGYPTVHFSIDGKSIKRKVHRLICIAFHGGAPTPRHEVRHLDGSKDNNKASNLKWGTKSENALDRQKHGTCKSAENGRKSAYKLMKDKCKRGHSYTYREK